MLLEMTTGTWILLGVVFFIALVLFIADAFHGENKERNKEILNTIIGIGIFVFIVWVLVETLS